MNDGLITNALGAAAAAFSVASFPPQIVKMVRAKDASGVSLRTYALTVACFVLWVGYGVRSGAWPITVANAAALLMSALILYLKWRYRTGAPRAEQSAK